MTCKRFRNSGRITNYEIRTFRTLPRPRRLRWIFVWASLADLAIFHPTSEADVWRLKRLGLWPDSDD